MLETIFLILLILGIILTILSIEWESRILCGFAIFIWLILAVTINQIQIPYQYIDPNTDTLMTGYQNIENMFPLSILFSGLAIILTVWMFFHLILPMLQGKIKDKKMF